MEIPVLEEVIADSRCSVTAVALSVQSLLRAMDIGFGLHFDDCVEPYSFLHIQNLMQSLFCRCGMSQILQSKLPILEEAKQ